MYGIKAGRIDRLFIFMDFAQLLKNGTFEKTKQELYMSKVTYLDHFDFLDKFADLRDNATYLAKYSIREIEVAISKSVTELTGRDSICSISSIEWSGSQMMIKLGLSAVANFNWMNQANKFDDIDENGKGMIWMREYLRSVAGEISLSDFTKEYGCDAYGSMERNAYSFGYIRKKVPYSGVCPYELTETGSKKLESLKTA